VQTFVIQLLFLGLSGWNKYVTQIEEIPWPNPFWVSREFRPFRGPRKAHDLFFREFLLLHVGLLQVDENLT
jgi:hypothetical protein